MTQTLVTIGTADAGNGDTPPIAFGVVNSNANDAESRINALELVTNPTTIYISEEADFPNQDTSNIYLDSGFNYTPIASYSTAKSTVFQGGRIMGIGKRNGVTVTYSGVGAQFVATDNNMAISDTIIAAPNGTHYSFTSSGGNFFTIAAITSASSVGQGTVTGCQGISLSQYTLLAASATTGFIFAGTSGVIAVDTYATIGAPSGFVTFDFGTSVFSGIKLTQFFQDTTQFLNNAASVAISGLVSSGNVVSGGLILVDTCNFTGLTSPLTNISVSDIRWEFMNSPPLQNSSKEADAFLSATQLVTIADSGVFVAIAGVLWLSEISERFTVSTSGVITAAVERDIKCMITLTITVEKVGGGTDQIESAISINGSLTGTGFTKSGAVTENASPTSIVSQRLTTISGTDTIQAYVANITGTANINAIKANLSIIEI
jgi:hypothetical protein